jgi:glutamate racemase
VNTKPIAVFDSGLGGLSVVRHLRQILPGEDIVYFGDTARVPYGTKSRRTVVSFALDAARFLLQFEPKLMVAACNTASALAIDALAAEIAVPVFGVVEPPAHAAVRIAAGRAIAVIGTEATVASGAYPAAIRAVAPDIEVVVLACPLFVPLVEEGRARDDPIVRLVVATYLEPLRRRDIRVVVLGCTHYPLLRSAIAEYLGPQVHIVGSGQETSRTVRRFLEGTDSLCSAERTGSIYCYVSDNPARLRQVGSRFLNEDIEHVEFVAPEHYISTATLEREPR